MLQQKVLLNTGLAGLMDLELAGKRKTTAKEKVTDLY